MHTGTNRIRSFFRRAILGAVFAAGLQGEDQEVTPSRERANRILDDAAAALGGAKFLSTHGLVASGWVGSWHGEVSRHMPARIYLRFTANQVEERHAYNKDESHAVLFNESGGFELTFRGARPLDASLVSRFREDSRNNILYILRQRRREPGLVAEYRGSSVCERQSGELVDILSANEHDPVVTVCFSSVTKLPIRQSYFRRHPLTRGRIEEVTIFARYFDAGNGVMWPRHIARLSDGRQINEVFLESVQVNQNLNAQLFEVPPGARPLKPIPTTEETAAVPGMRGE
jgi:hypothetical protein